MCSESKKPTSLQVMLGTYLNGDERSMCIALPEVTWSGAAEYQRLSDGGDVRHPYARCYREAMKVTMHVKFREESSWH